MATPTTRSAVMQQEGTMSGTLTGGDVVVQALKAAGVEVVFGVISVHNVPIYDALARRGGIRAVASRSEPGAVHMADGYSRASGKLGVAITSTGPGAGNACGALVETYAAGSPVLHLTSQIPSAYLDKQKGFIHEAKDQLGMLRSVSKQAYRPASAADIGPTLVAAIEDALNPPAGPVSVEIPIDYQEGNSEMLDLAIDCPQRAEPSPDAIRCAAEILGAARRPLIWAGSGVIAADAAPELRALAEDLGAGVVTSMYGRGALPENHPLCVGPLGSGPAVQQLLDSADALLAVGTRFRSGDTGGWRMRPPKNLVQVDVDPQAIGRNYPAAAEVIGDAKLALAALQGALPSRSQIDPGFEGEILDARAKARRDLRVHLGPYEQVLDELVAMLPRETIRVRDVTVHAGSWGDRLWEVYEPRTSIATVARGIGQSVQMAIGAKLGRPDRPVVVICGDGGFMINPGEWATAVQERLSIVLLLFNDGGYGVIRSLQGMKYDGREIGVNLATPDFVRFAESLGAWARRVSKLSDFRPTMEAALEVKGPALVEMDAASIGPMAHPYVGGGYWIR